MANCKAILWPNVIYESASTGLNSRQSLLLVVISVIGAFAFEIDKKFREQINKNTHDGGVRAMFPSNCSNVMLEN